MRSITRWDVAVSVFLFLVAYNGGTQTMLLCVIAFFLWLLVRPKVIAPSTAVGATTKVAALMSAPESEADEEDNGFEIDSHAEGGAWIELGVDIDFHPCPNHFRFHDRYDTASGKREYEYRVEGVKVFMRLIHDIDDGMGTPRGGEWRVRDGVVLEADMRARFDARDDSVKQIHNFDKEITDLRTSTEWQEMQPLDWSGVLAFILSKTAPAADVRRLYRGELERIKTGVAKVWKELDRIGIEPSAESKDGMRAREGSPHAVFDEAVWANANITRNEFWGRDHIIARLQELLSPDKKKP